MVLLLAFSLQDQVEKYGSYVGIAAFFGLAVLSLLYFAQAREVKRLREWAGRAPERAREVEERAIAQAEAARRQPAPVARPAAQPIAAATAAGGRSGTVSPAVPVGAATAVVERDEDDEEEPVVYGPPTEDGKGPVLAIEPPPKVEEDEPDQPDADEDERDEEEPAAAAPATNGAPPPGAEPPAIPRPSTAAAAAGVKPAAPGPSAAGGAPATAAGGDVPSPADGAAAGAAAASAPAEGAPGGVPPKPGARPVRPAAAQLRQTTSSASPRRPVTMPPRRPGTPPPAAEPSGGHRGRAYAIAGGIAAVVVALGVLAATQFLGNDDNKPKTPNQAASPTAAATDEAGSGSNSGGGSSSAPTSRADTTVAVFNGTTISGLAASTADKLRSSGYKRGTTGDYTDQQRASSTVFYTKAARRQAREIGRELNISELRVMDAETQALAGQNADVAVVVGSDKAP
jgi:LytR cell envelope-related transcriptional attenuator